MKLTRRRTLLGLAGAGSAASLGAYDLTADADTDADSAERTVTRRDVDGLLTVADVVHPADPEPFEPLIRGYVGRLSDERTRALLGTLSELDALSYDQSGTPFRSLSAAEGRRLLKRLGVFTVQSRPEGTLAERVRFHLVNSVLYALLTNPEGTKQFGIENPVGYPGGFSSYTE
ncbi:gluconate 2-dehydrogenase subunit 3 family protein [Halopelagius fulvigenes]|uniref:Gluconate 2-dehydrogenase subunit 3 family protein n=1 Tax=Halopelagius fulvigenes TaxID=1198324 RepID=A0ABD5U2R2_9EURY